MASFMARLRKGYNAFSQLEEDTYQPPVIDYGTSYGTRPDRQRLRFSNERSIVTSIYTRIAIDIASVTMRHVRLDDQGRYLEDMDSEFNECLMTEANIDQAATAFRQDMAMSLCDNGVIAIVPVDTSVDPRLTDSYDILTMRVGEIVQWFPQHVRVKVYNERTGRREELTLHKRKVAIVENPLYSIMNEPNSTLQRLIHKLNLLDSVDEASASGKLDLIIQLPYVIKSEARRQQAIQRRDDIEFQLKEGKYGIAYTDGTEKITQLNRPAENNLMGQIEYLTKMLYGQLGLTEEIMNGTADEKTILNYWNRTIKPLSKALVEGMRRTFLTKTARTQKQSVLYFLDSFQLVPIEKIAEIADVFARNEIASSNEIRQLVGWKPSTDPKADQLVNSNMPQGSPPTAEDPAADPSEDDGLDEIDQMMSEIEGILGVTDEEDSSA